MIKKVVADKQHPGVGMFCQAGSRRKIAIHNGFLQLFGGMDYDVTFGSFEEKICDAIA